MSSDMEMLEDGVKPDSHSVTSERKEGVHISTATAFILAFLAIAIVVGVGLVVHFAGSGRTIDCACTFPTPETGNGNGDQTALEQCASWAGDGNQQICGACADWTNGTTCRQPTASTQTSTVSTTQISAASTGVTTSSVTTPKPEIDVRLPLDIEPLLYTLELQSNMYDGEPSDFTFNGSMSVLVHCKFATDKIVLHSKKLNIAGPISLTEENGDSLLYKEHTFDTEREFMIVHATQMLLQDRNYTLTIGSFLGPLSPDYVGLHLYSYQRDNETIYVTASQMQPTDARKAFPCWDEPAIKAQFDVTLVRKDHMTSLSNMPISRSEARGGGWVADKFETTAKMSTYLLAFIICDFKYLEKTTENNVIYRTWSRPEAINQTSYSLDVGAEILMFFEEYFNIPYPLPKQDMIAIPGFGAGGMENWGLITYRETAMLYEPAVFSEDNKQWVANVVSHELAHQWFGNLVTPAWWDDLWLNEGFSTYMQYLGVDHVYSDWKMFEQFVVDDLHFVFNIDGLVTSHPVYVPVSHPDEITPDQIVYKKGASIIRMMHLFLGEDTFRNGLTNYLKNLEYGAASHDDLWYALGNQSVSDGNQITNVKEIMDTWTLQMNFPVVNVHYTHAGRISLAQSRYLRDPTAEDTGKYVSPFGYKWEIPFTFTTNVNTNFNVTKDDVTVINKNIPQVDIVRDTILAPEGANWVVGNAMQYGFYRVNYDERNWLAIIHQLRTDHTVIAPINRAQIINDAWNLARSGELRMHIALRTTEYLSRERAYVPRSAATDELAHVDTLLSRHPLYGSFSRFMQNVTRDAFEEIGMDNTGATHLESLQRSRVAATACSYGIQSCVDEAKRLFGEWMKRADINPINPGLKETVYRTAVAEGGIGEWEFILRQYRESNVAAEKSRLLTALSYTRKIWILNKFLKMSITPGELGPRDTYYVLTAVARNPIGRCLAWSFFQENWNLLLNKFRHRYAWPGIVDSLTSTFTTDFELDKLKKFIDSKENLGPGANAFAQALEKTQSNIQWMDTNAPIIGKWLTDQGF